MSKKTKGTKELTGSEITRAIRARGMTVTGWALVHGYAAISVLKIIHGKYGNPGPIANAILRDLRKEGFLTIYPLAERRHARKSA